ncbi:MAG TPA: DUF2293 domain-containing protein [Nocardioidaceae bacterium]|nr:DUF2293 domain-containing protein [Nocardioidaceae bacterium]
MSEAPPDQQNLDVYDKGAGLWNPDHGELDVPEGWEFLPSGDAFLTRRVKAEGVYWVAYRPRGRRRPHRRLLGLWAPAGSISAARDAAAETAERRAKVRASGAVYRAHQEQEYVDQLHAAVLGFLCFDAAHRELAEGIATEAAARAGEVGSGRVGRTRTIPLEERAELAARACIRHRYTDYEEQLDKAREALFAGEEMLRLTLDDEEYHLIKDSAHRQVEEFLERHRRG